MSSLFAGQWLVSICLLRESARAVGHCGFSSHFGSGCSGEGPCGCPDLHFWQYQLGICLCSSGNWLSPLRTHDLFLRSTTLELGVLRRWHRQEIISLKSLQVLFVGARKLKERIFWVGVLRKAAFALLEVFTGEQVTTTVTTAHSKCMLLCQFTSCIQCCLSHEWLKKHMLLSDHFLKCMLHNTVNMWYFSARPSASHLSGLWVLCYIFWRDAWMLRM